MVREIDRGIRRGGVVAKMSPRNSRISQPGLLSSLPEISSAVTRRESSWDRSGGNKDSETLDPGATHVMAEIEGAGQITHIWMTVASPDLNWGRRIVLKAYWDEEEEASIEVPLGDFFGQGNCRFGQWWSMAFSAGPVGGRGLNCWLPMPFYDHARIEIENQGPLPAPAIYYYVDYESWPSEHGDTANLGRLHAVWNRESPTDAVDHSGSKARFGFRGANLTGDENYVLLEAEGQGHYVGCHLFIHNVDGGWWGEGDDMIFIDGEPFPPRIHGTGSEDYFGTSWCPSETYSSPFHGISYAERKDWKGFSSWFRFHLLDPVRFQKSIRVTIEHGHANDRSDDWSSVAYWYQTEPHMPRPPLPPPADRIPPVAPEAAEPLRRAEELMNNLYEQASGTGDGSDTQLAVFGRMFLLGQEFEKLSSAGNWQGITELLDSIRL